jgi:hypothetical protein
MEVQIVTNLLKRLKDNMKILLILTIIIALIILIFGIINLFFYMREGYLLTKEIQEIFKYFFNKKK